MAAEINNTKIMSIEDIVNKFIGDDDSSPISSWLVNVIETYLNDTQSIEPLTINKLFHLTNDMFITYSISNTESQSKELCTKLIELLQSNHHLPAFNEPFPINAKCIALYAEDNEWYPCTVIKVLQSGHSYLIQFDGYGNTQNVTIQQIAAIQQEESIESPETEKYGISLKEKLIEKTQKDLDLEKLIMTDISGNGLKKKNPKYVNDMMELHEVNEDKLALALSNEEEKQFALFIDGKEKDDHLEMDENDVEKYTVGEGKNKRRINPLNDICCICERVLPLTWHHLIPKCTHNEYMKQHPNTTRLFLNKHGIWICRQCHSAIHGIHNNRELMKNYWKLDMLLECEKVQKWIKYVSKQRVSGHYDRRANKQNNVAQMIKKKDPSMTVKYV